MPGKCVDGTREFQFRYEPECDADGFFYDMQCRRPGRGQDEDTPGGLLGGGLFSFNDDTFGWDAEFRPARCTCVDNITGIAYGGVFDEGDYEDCSEVPERAEPHCLRQCFQQARTLGFAFADEDGTRPDPGVVRDLVEDGDFRGILSQYAQDCDMVSAVWDCAERTCAEELFKLEVGPVLQETMDTLSCNALDMALIQPDGDCDLKDSVRCSDVCNEESNTECLPKSITQFRGSWCGCADWVDPCAKYNDDKITKKTCKKKGGKEGCVYEALTDRCTAHSDLSKQGADHEWNGCSGLDEKGCKKKKNAGCHYASWAKDCVNTQTFDANHHTEGCKAIKKKGDCKNFKGVCEYVKIKKGARKDLGYQSGCYPKGSPFDGSDLKR